MKLIELEINNVRGIRHLKIEQNEKNFVICGPNGSGKSAVVDAIDFLLTGRISRLTGEGTGDISLGKHGPHINYPPKEAEVRAKIKIPYFNEPIELKRCIAQPRKLEYDTKFSTTLEPILELAKQGQYILTRRDILKYVTANPSTRADEIQNILNIRDIEAIRRNLVKIQNNYKKDLENAKKTLKSAEETVLATVQKEEFSENIILHFINQNRAILKGDPISILSREEFKKEIIAPKVSMIAAETSFTSIEEDIQYLLEIIMRQNQEKVFNLNEELHDMIQRIKGSPQIVRNLSRLKLTNLGMTLIDETGDCPLCDTQWPIDELDKYLKERLSSIQNIKIIWEDINRIIKEISSYINRVIISIENILRQEKIVDVTIKNRLNSWLQKLSKFLNILTNVLEYNFNTFNLNLIKTIFAPDNIADSLKDIKSNIRKGTLGINPKQEAWDNLTRLEEDFKIYEDAKEGLDLLNKLHQRTTILLREFVIARDLILGNLYEEIKDRFVELYKKLHDPDEEDFSAILRPAGPGLNFEVDFYGKGVHPPHALHSEGHQDSMGLCLYLALAEKVNQGLINLVVLDDVVMSVDADHRRSMCSLLKQCFPEQQFLITTHDKTWTNQLKSEGVVNTKGIVEFYNWNIDTGPLHMNYEIDVWTPINKDLERNDIPNAAARLRRGLEQFFAMVCDNLQAKVVYKLNSRYELGNFLGSAVGKFRDLLKQGKNVANSWGNEELIDELNKIDSIVGQIYKRTNTEQWAVNASVHYNNWTNFTKNDFLPVVEAFQDLCQLFVCNDCGGILQLIQDRRLIPITVRCKCGKIDWNLVKNK